MERLFYEFFKTNANFFENIFKSGKKALKVDETYGKIYTWYGMFSERSVKISMSVPSSTKRKDAHIRNERCRRYQREAREVLSFGQNYLSVLFTILALMFFFGCAIFFTQCFYRALTLSDISLHNEQLLYTVYSLFSSVILFLMLSPLYVGAVTYLVDVYHTRSAHIGHVPHTGIFCFYSGIESAVRAWKIAFFRLIGLAFFPAFAQLLYLFAKAALPVLEKQNAVGALLGYLCLIAIAILLFAVALTVDLYVKVFLIYAVIQPTSSLLACLYTAMRHFIARIQEGMMLLLQFTPWMLLSLLSAGVMFLLYALPYILFSEISYCIHLMMEAKEM